MNFDEVRASGKFAWTVMDDGNIAMWCPSRDDAVYPSVPASAGEMLVMLGCHECPFAEDCHHLGQDPEEDAAYERLISQGLRDREQRVMLEALMDGLFDGPND